MGVKTEQLAGLLRRTLFATPYSEYRSCSKSTQALMEFSCDYPSDKLDAMIQWRIRNGI